MASRMLVLFLVCAVAHFTKEIAADAESDKVIADVFNKADQNKDGKWTFEEYLQRDENLIKFERDRFNEMDTNRDKAITLDENKVFFLKQANEQEKRDKEAAAAPKPTLKPKERKPKTKTTPKPKRAHRN